MSFEFYLLLNGLVAVAISCYTYFILIPAYKEDYAKGSILSVLLVVLFILVFIIHVEGIKEKKKELIKPSDYEIVKSQGTVHFVYGSKNLQTQKAKIYNNAQDTSKVKLYKIEEYNWFNQKKKSYLQITY